MVAHSSRPASSASLGSASSSEPFNQRPRINWKPHSAQHTGTRPCHPECRGACGRSTNRPSTTRACSAKRHGGATDTPLLASVDNSSGSIAVSGASSPPCPCQRATENDFWSNSRYGTPSKLGPSNRGSQSKERRFKRPGIPAHGVISSPAAPHTATLVRFDFFSNESGSEVRTISRGADIGTMNGLGELLGSRHKELVPRNSALIVLPMG